MKFLLGIIIVILRFYIGIKILYWIILKLQSPQFHSISEIDVFLVSILFDIWISTSHGNIEVGVIKKEN